jgi:inner membrane protein
LDSVTQAALGAAVGTAVMGRSRPLWQAALIGAAVGTLPDLDVFIDKGDPVRNMVLHRAETHALFWQALVSPAIALALAWMTRSRELFWRWWLMVVLTLFSHSLLDAMTVYGTRLGLPFSDHPFGRGSLFIIDPLYTLPLLLGLMMAGIVRSRRRRHWNTAGLLLSSAYALWSLGAQAHVGAIVRDTAEAQGLPPERILVTATPFNTVLWRIVLMHDEHYYEGFYSLLDRPLEPDRAVAFRQLPRGAALDRRTAGFVEADMIRDFSKGFYALHDDGHQLHITDLRMGQHPYFAFSFAFAEHHSEPVTPIPPVRNSRRIPLAQGLEWLWARMQGQAIAPPEAAGPCGGMRTDWAIVEHRRQAAGADDCTTG